MAEGIKEDHPIGPGGFGEAQQLWTKLEIPKGDDQIEIGDDHQKKNNSNLKVCRECNKVFGSGKALGGHMRIHVQAYKELLISNKKKKLKAKQAIKFKKQQKRPKVFDLGNDDEFTDSATGNNVDSKSKKPTCVLCGKNFQSMKSLFGHMRCHPGREWRGIEPPPAAAAKDSSLSWASSDAAELYTGHADNNDEQIDDASAGINSNIAEEVCTVNLTECLPKWSVTAQRGERKPPNHVTDNSAAFFSSSSDSEEEEFREAAHDLLMLANGDCFDESSVFCQKPKHGENFDVTNSYSLTTNFESDDASDSVIWLKRRRVEKHTPDVYDEDQTLMQHINEGKGSSDGGNDDEGLQQSSNLMNLGGKGKSVVKKSEDWPNTECENQDSSNNEDSEMNCDINCDGQSPNGKVVFIKNKKRKKMKLRGLEFKGQDDASPVHQAAATITTAGKYRCSTCEKCFPTHQALGGHRSSHNKFRIFIQNSIDEYPSAAAANNSLISLVEGNKDIDEGALSSSKLVDCGAQHQCNVCKKYFLSGQALGGHMRCHWNCSGEVSCHSTGPTTLGFDLNEAPGVDEADQQEAAAGYECIASSSYHSSVSN